MGWGPCNITLHNPMQVRLLGIGLVGLVVRPQSAGLLAKAAEQLDPPGRDHCSVCWPSSKEDPVYQRVLEYATSW